MPRIVKFYLDFGVLRLRCSTEGLLCYGVLLPDERVKVLGKMEILHMGIVINKSGGSFQRTQRNPKLSRNNENSRNRESVK